MTAARVRPVEADPRGARLDLGGAEQGREGERHAVEHALRGPGRGGAGMPFLGLVLLPRLGLRRRRGDLGIAKDMRMAAHHLVGDRRGDVGEIEQPGLLGHARVKDDLKQQVAELVLERRHVAARDRIGDLVRLLDRIGRDRREILLAVPRAAALRVAQPRHDREQSVEGRRRHRAILLALHHRTPHRAAQARIERR